MSQENNDNHENKENKENTENQKKLNEQINSNSDQQAKSKKQFVCDLQVKEVVDTTFLLKSVLMMEGRDGRSYLNLILSDKSGDLEARIWNNAQEINARIEQGNLVKVKGKINLFQNRKQLIVSEIDIITAEELASSNNGCSNGNGNSNIDLSVYLTKSSQNIEDMFKRICDIVENLIEDQYIKKLLTIILSDNEISKKLKIWPAGKNIHHAYQSGLLEHILSCTESSLMLGKHYNVNISYLVAAAILHDIGKIYELTSGFNIDYTNEGKLIGHVIKGLEIVDLFSSKINNFPNNIKMHLKHILLSHHGEYVYGSAKLPQTREALLFHMIDLMDSKMGAMDMIIKNDPLVGDWSSYIKHIDRIVFKAALPTQNTNTSANTNANNDEQLIKANNSRENNNENKKEIKTKMGNLLKDFKID
ncbi:MAG: HD domain-containing protein [Oligoflexia bacterium]|nr:HD domain-containing protein [Oligoflexia bacterium]